MIAALSQDLISKTPRENAGPRAFNRFTFQNDWALCHLLNLHEGDEDYLLVFDYHDDVLELDAVIDPTSVKFYQVKSAKKGNWTAAQLLTQKKGKDGPKLSYLGKLYHHATLFDEQVDGLFFVSNIPLKVSLGAGKDSKSRSDLPFTEIIDPDASKIASGIQNEHGLSAQPSLNKFCFKVTPLSVDDHKTHSLGHVARFLTTFLGTQSVPADVFFKTLAEEIQRRAEWEYQTSDWQTFCRKKGISREEMNGFLSAVVDQATAKNVGDRYVPKLESEGWNFGATTKIRKSLRSVEVELMNHTDTMLHMAKEAIATECDILQSSEGFEDVQLSDVISQLMSNPSEPVKDLSKRKSSEYLQSLILVCIYEQAR